MWELDCKEGWTQKNWCFWIAVLEKTLGEGWKFYTPLQQYMNCEIPDVQAKFFSKFSVPFLAQKPEIKLPTSTGSSKKQENYTKTPTSALLTVPNPFTVWITTNCGKFWKRWEYQIILPAFWETYMQVKKQQLESDMEQQTGSKMGKECVKAIHCHSTYLTYIQSTSCEMPG